METSLSTRPPATGGVFFYPAQRRATFPSPRAALAHIGCCGQHAELILANARAEGSPVITAPVTLRLADCECIAAIVRKPGGKAALWLGLIGEATAERGAAYELAAELASEVGGKWGVFEWVRQSGTVQ